MVDNFKLFEGKKFMWDGEEYESEAGAKEKLKTYKKEGFETRLFKEEDKVYVYSRRVVKDIVVEGEPV